VTENQLVFIRFTFTIPEGSRRMSKLLHELLAEFDDTAPLHAAESLQSPWYVEPALAAVERRAVFGDTWQAVGRVDQVADVGSFFTVNLAGEPILVVRDADRTLRAFANVCRHRGSQVLCETAGRASKLQCQYHGWTYDLSGRLRGTPEFDGVANFDKQHNGLPEYAVAIWGPMVWVHCGRNPPPLEQTLPTRIRRTDELKLDSLQFVSRREYRLDCNWKVFVDNYLDGGYHVNTVHPDLAGVLDYSEYRTELFDACSLQSSPLTTGADAVVNQVRTGVRACYWWIYPNFMMNVYDGVMDTNVVLPDGPDRCRVLFDFYFSEPTAPGRSAMIEQSISVSDRIQQEDAVVCEAVQRGLQSRSYRRGRFSVKREMAGYHFHQLYIRQLRAAVDGVVS
jgi:choline monooxygenase